MSFLVSLSCLTLHMKSMIMSLTRTADNLYFPGVVKAMENGQVNINLDDGDAVTHSANRYFCSHPR